MLKHQSSLRNHVYGNTSLRDVNDIPCGLNIVNHACSGHRIMIYVRELESMYDTPIDITCSYFRFTFNTYISKIPYLKMLKLSCNALFAKIFLFFINACLLLSTVTNNILFLILY